MRDKQPLGQIFLGLGMISDDQLQSGLAEQQDSGRPLGRTLIEMGIVSEAQLVSALSAQLSLPSVDLDRTDIDPLAIAVLDAQFCQEHDCLPFGWQEKGRFLDVAMTDPTNESLFDAIRVLTRSNVRPYIAGPVAIDAAIKRCYSDEPTRSRRPASAAVHTEVASEVATTRANRSPTVAMPAVPNEHRRQVTQQLEPVAAVSSGETSEMVQLLAEIVELRGQVEQQADLLRRVRTVLINRGLAAENEI